MELDTLSKRNAMEVCNLQVQVLSYLYIEYEISLVQDSLICFWSGYNIFETSTGIMLHWFSILHVSTVKMKNFKPFGYLGTQRITFGLDFCCCDGHPISPRSHFHATYKWSTLYLGGKVREFIFSWPGLWSLQASQWDPNHWFQVNSELNARAWNLWFNSQGHCL